MVAPPAPDLAIPAPPPAPPRTPASRPLALRTSAPPAFPARRPARPSWPPRRLPGGSARPAPRPLPPLPEAARPPSDWAPRRTWRQDVREAMAAGTLGLAAAWALAELALLVGG